MEENHLAESHNDQDMREEEPTQLNFSKLDQNASLSMPVTSTESTKGSLSHLSTGKAEDTAFAIGASENAPMPKMDLNSMT